MTFATFAWSKSISSVHSNTHILIKIYFDSSCETMGLWDYVDHVDSRAYLLEIFGICWLLDLCILCLYVRQIKFTCSWCLYWIRPEFTLSIAESP
ncbi:hypothetical protein BpHYR1_051681 [Brachionus plicatilis]|uniref:Uncharacterized protein n=1 Tax=Brachionus plicatilis TaxID=10195 RepID=A0A3M7SR26_BRAPC|nr:hypothetical protein BpHYR1_051681 [Brachionus plicatilis]